MSEPEPTSHPWTVTADSVPCWLEPGPPTITISGADGQPLVTIHPNGELDYGPNYTPDAAARAFWDALRNLAPARCPACGHTGLEAL